MGDLREAFAALAGGDLDALAPVFAEMGRQLYALALWRTGSATEAEDVVQDAFVRLARLRDELRDVREPRAFLLALAHRIAIDRGRRRRRRAECALDEAAMLTATGDDPEAAVEAGRAARALAALPPPQRAAVGLHVVYGMTFREVARATGVPLFTAASRVRLGLRRMKKMLEDER